MPQISGADKEKCSEAPEGLKCSLTQNVAVSTRKGTRRGALWGASGGLWHLPLFPSDKCVFQGFFICLLSVISVYFTDIFSCVQHVLYNILLNMPLNKVYIINDNFNSVITIVVCIIYTFNSLLVILIISSSELLKQVIY